MDDEQGVKEFCFERNVTGTRNPQFQIKMSKN